jgi:dipeptidyl aminopeptidase/acylaminoacyl peptidase
MIQTIPTIPTIRTRLRAARRALVISIAALGAALLAHASPACAARLGPEEQLRLQQLADPQIAPDASAVAFVASGFDAERRSRSTVWLAGRAGGEARELTPAPATGSGPRWAPDSRWLALLLRPAAGEEPRLAVLDPPGGGRREFEATRGARALQWAPDGRRIAFTRPDPPGPEEAARRARGDDAAVIDESPAHVRLWILDVASGEARRLDGEAATVWSFSWSPDGRELVLLASPTGDAEGQEYKSALYLADAESGAWRRLAPRASAHAAPSFSPDGSRVAYLAPLGDFLERGVPHVVGRDGGEPRALLADYPGNVFDLAWHPRADLLVAGLGESTRHWLATVGLDGRVEKRLELRHSFMPYWERVWSLSADGGEAAFTSEEGNGPREVHRARFAAGAAREPVSRLNAPLAALELGAVEALRWRRADGAEVEGILVHPPGAAPGAVPAGGPAPPLLVWLHGGPAYHWGLGSQLAGWGQLFAAAGYRVLLPNFRGSSGYGMAWMRANVRDWGDGPLQDVLAGVDHLVARGLADPRRLFVGGGSYGGYLTYWAITHDARFRAAALRAGVSELTSQFALTDEPSFMLGYFGRSPFDDPEVYRAQSPLTHTARATTPVLILQGERDLRVPPSQSFLAYRALRHAGVEAQLVLYPREGHSISEYHHQVDHMRRILDWYRRWDAPAAPR